MRLSLGAGLLGGFLAGLPDKTTGFSGVPAHVTQPHINRTNGTKG